MLVNKKSFKICVSATGENLEDKVDPRFGRCEYFVIVGIDQGEISDVTAFKNIGASQNQGAGIRAAEQVGKLGVDLLITGDLGPKAAEVIDKLKIEVYKKSGEIKTAVIEYLDGLSQEEDQSSEISQSPADLKSRLFIPLMNDEGGESEISLHFGHAPYFGIFDKVRNEFIIKENSLDHNDPAQSPVDQIITAVDPTMVFAQDMGARAIGLFTAQNIILKTGPYKIAQEVIDHIDDLSDLTKSCAH